MESGYFGSREFAVALGAGLFVLLVATSGAVLTGGFEDAWGGSPCEDDFRVADVSPVQDSGPHSAGGWTKREINYRFDAVSRLERLDLCTEVGRIDVRAHNGTHVEVVVRPQMEGFYHDEVDAVRPEVVYRSGDAGGRLWVHIEHPPRVVSVLKDRSGSVDIEVRVPHGTAIGSLEADGDVGRRHIQDIEVERLSLLADVGDFTVTNVTTTERAVFRVDVGDLVGTGVRLLGDVIGRTDVGDVDLQVAHVANGTWDIRTDVGDVSLTVPGGDAYGYRLDIACDVGSARAEIGATATDQRQDGGPSERLRTESVDYGTRVFRADIVIRTDVGSGTVRTG